MAQQRRGGFKRRKKVDYIAANKIEYVDYKDTELLSRFVSERGKILPRRVTGTSAKNQRKVTTAIKRARVMALMPFVNEDSSGSLSTVVGDEKLCARENDFRSLSLYVQSDENLGSKVLEVTKAKRLPFDVFNKLVSGFQFGIGIRLLQSVGNISFVL